MRLIVEYNGDCSCSWIERTRDLMLIRVASLLAIDPTLQLVPISETHIELHERGVSIPAALHILMLRAKRRAV